MSLGPKLETNRITLKIGERTVLSDITLSLDGGQIVGLIGPNGAGKSSLLRVLSGLYPDFSGEARVGNSSLRTLMPIERARKVTYVGAELDTDFPLTVAEYVALGTFSIGASMAGAELDRVLAETGCEAYRYRSLSELSSGERQRAHLARALLQGSNWICLDESFSRLDLHHQARMGKLLREYVRRGTSFIFVSHDLNFTTDWADRCVLLRDGHLIADGPTSTTVNIENLRALYPDADLVLTPHPVTGALKVYFRG
jgi:iron complex transport system ATP-binding protein